MTSWDCASWLAAIGLAVFARSGMELANQQWSAVGLYAFGACVFQLAAGFALKLYRGRFRTGSFEEIVGLGFSAALVAVVLGSLVVGLRAMEIPELRDFPRSIAVLSPPIALLFMGAGRWGYRTWRAHNRAPGGNRTNVLVYGAGDLGEQVIRLIQTDTTSPYRVVGLIDDNRSKRNLQLRGVPVRGTRAELVAVARKLDASAVILAISHADATMVRDVQDLVEGAHLTFKVLPHISELIGGRVRLSDVRDVEITDILGRHEIETDVSAIADYLARRRVLITGAGGSIGSELARQVQGFGPSELVLLDRDESGLHAVQLSLYGKALLDTPDMVLADIRDIEALRPVFERHRPEVVFHAAALKHLPMLEQYPEEGWKTNVLGTKNVLALSAEYGVQKFVNISTDKAANPTSVLGRTKRMAEQLTAWQASHAYGTFVSVRFGNVLGSRGSMLQTFVNQIENGGPVTVTHPEITRYFMTIPEACELVIQAAAIGHDGEVLVLDMGRPVKILEVAEYLIAHAGKKIDILFTGLRPGEKLHEDLFSDKESGARPLHPLISHVAVPPIDPADLGGIHDAVTLGGRRAAGRSTWPLGEQRSPAGKARWLMDEPTKDG